MRHIRAVGIEGPKIRKSVVGIGLTYLLKSGWEGAIAPSAPTHPVPSALHIIAHICVACFGSHVFATRYLIFSIGIRILSQYAHSTYLHIMYTTALCMNQLVHRGWYNE